MLRALSSSPSTAKKKRIKEAPPSQALRFLGLVPNVVTLKTKNSHYKLVLGWNWSVVLRQEVAVAEPHRVAQLAKGAVKSEGTL